MIEYTEKGCLVIYPEGDILFATAYPEDGSKDFIELVIAQPGGLHETGTLLPEHLGKDTEDINSVVRVKMTPEVCAILIERIAMIQVELMGMPPMTRAPND